MKRSYPIPRDGQRDWKGVVVMLRGMAEEAQYRADDLTRSDELRAGHRATAGAYHFAASMLELQFMSK